MKMRLKLSSAKLRPFCLGGDELIGLNIKIDKGNFQIYHKTVFMMMYDLFECNVGWSKK